MYLRKNKNLCIFLDSLLFAPRINPLINILFLKKPFNKKGFILLLRTNRKFPNIPWNYSFDKIRYGELGEKNIVSLCHFIRT